MNSSLFPILSSEQIEKLDNGGRDEGENITLVADKC